MKSTVYPKVVSFRIKDADGQTAYGLVHEVKNLSSREVPGDAYVILFPEIFVPEHFPVTLAGHSMYVHQIPASYAGGTMDWATPINPAFSAQFGLMMDAIKDSSVDSVSIRITRTVSKHLAARRLSPGKE